MGAALPAPCRRDPPCPAPLLGAVRCSRPASLRRKPRPLRGEVGLEATIPGAKKPQQTTRKNNKPQNKRNETALGKKTTLERNLLQEQPGTSASRGGRARAAAEPGQGRLHPGRGVRAMRARRRRGPGRTQLRRGCGGVAPAWRASHPGWSSRGRDGRARGREPAGRAGGGGRAPRRAPQLLSRNRRRAEQSIRCYGGACQPAGAHLRPPPSSPVRGGAGRRGLPARLAGADEREESLLLLPPPPPPRPVLPRQPLPPRRRLLLLLSRNFPGTASCDRATRPACPAAAAAARGPLPSPARGRRDRRAPLSAAHPSAEGSASCEGRPAPVGGDPELGPP